VVSGQALPDTYINIVQIDPELMTLPEKVKTDLSTIFLTGQQHQLKQTDISVGLVIMF